MSRIIPRLWGLAKWVNRNAISVRRDSGIQGDGHVWKSGTLLAIQPDIQMKMLKRQLEPTTLEFGEKSSSSSSPSVSSSLPCPRRWDYGGSMTLSSSDTVWPSRSLEVPG